MLKEILRFAGAVSAIALMSGAFVAFAPVAKAGDLDGAKLLIFKAVAGANACGVTLSEADFKVLWTDAASAYELSDLDMVKFVAFMNDTSAAVEFAKLGKTAWDMSEKDCGKLKKYFAGQ